ncbi:FG-GAP-like repeat-containing protein [Marinoscillum sp.]|uniref:FG-GAP-like repeat-containing protein n=1 Tax=Marinoscillum sp. TaxID=2024838 RepID=UPI0033037B5D
MKGLRAIGYVILMVTGTFLQGQNFSKVTITAFEAMTDARAEWVDFNNDNYLDLFVSGTNNGGTFKVVVYFNNGDDTFSALTIANLDDVAYDFGDYNHDTYIDILLSGVDSGGNKYFTVYKNNSGTSFSAQSFGLSGFSRGGVKWYDVDQDGDLDILSMGLNASNQRVVAFYEYTSASYQSVATSIAPLSNGVVGILDANQDGIIEVLFSGFNTSGDAKTAIYSLSKEWESTLYTGTLEGYALNSYGLGDYDEDGFVDLLMTGFSESASESSDLFTNNQVNSFIQESPFLQDLSASSVDFGDVDNDGLLDILLTGLNGSTKYIQYYQNAESAGSYSFSNVAVTMENIFDGDIALGDYDNDGDLDVFQVGNSDLAFQANLYESDMAATRVNAAPNVPVIVSGVTSEDSVTLTWNAATDDRTAAASVTYNFYISTNPSGSGLVVAPLSNLADGYRQVMLPGNARNQTSFTVHQLPEGIYYWGVQAVDNNFKGSDFATEESFTVCYAVNMGNDTTICKFEYVELEIADPEVDVVNWFTKTDGLVLSNSLTYNHQALKQDTVIAEITKTFGCTVYDTLIVEVYDLPSFDLGNYTTICYGEYFDLSVSDLGIVGLDSVNWYSTGLGSLLQNNESLSYEVLTKDTLIAEVFNVNGCVNWDTLIVEVYDLPLFNLGNDTTICYGQYFDLSVSDLGIVGLDSVNWYSTGLGSLIKDNESLSYEVLTKDTLIAEVFNVNGCVNWDTLIVEVYDLPSFNLGNDTTICYGQYFELSVSDLGIVGLDSVNWYSTGLGSLIKNNESLSYEVLTKDTLIAEVFNVNGCVNWDTLIVEVYDLPSFNLGNDTTICYGQYFELSVSDLGIVGLDSVNWYSTGLGSLLQNSELLSYEVLTKDTLIAEVFNVNGCVNWDTLIVEVYDLPSFDLGNDTTICYGQYFELSVSDLGIVGLDSVNWYSTGLGSLIKDNESLSYEVLTKDTLIAEVFNVNGCVNWDTLVVEVYDLPSFDLGNDTTICYGQYFDLSVSDLGIIGLDSVNWYSTGLGSLLQNNESLSYEVLTRDTLIAEVFNVNGCVNWDTLVVEVYDLPSFNLGNDTTICYGQYFDLSVSDLGIDGLDSVNWYSTGLGSLLQNNESLSYEVLTKDTLIAEVFNVNGCVNWDTLIVEVYDLPSFNLGNDSTICYGQYFELSVSDLGIVGLDSVNWYSTGLGSLIKDNESLSYEVLTKDTLIAEVFNLNGCVNWDTLIVDVFALPVFDIGKDTSVCFELSILLETGPLYDEVNWYSRYTGEELQSESWFFNYQVIATDTLIAEVYDVNRCLNFDTIRIEMDPLPDHTLGPDEQICFLDTVHLAVTGSWPEVNWYTDGDQLLQADQVTYDFKVEETIEIWSEVYSAKGCVQYDTIQVEMLPLPTFDLPEESVYCFGDTITSDVGSIGQSYEWRDGQQNLLSEASLWETVATESLTVSLLVTDENACTYSDTTHVLVNVLPQFTIQGDPVICQYDSTTLSIAFDLPDSTHWYTASGSLFTNTESVRLSPDEHTWVFADLIDQNECLWTDSVEVIVNERPLALAGRDTLICYGGETLLGADDTESDWTYQWTPALGLSQADLARPLATPESTMAYQLEVINAEGCNAIDSVWVQVNPKITVDAGSDVAICLGDTIAIGGVPSASGSLFGYQYSWRPNVGLKDIYASNPQVSPEVTTRYYLEVYSGYCPPGSDSVLVTVNYAPEITVSAQQSVGPDESVMLSADGGVAYVWTPENTLDDPFSATPQASPLETTLYTVQVTDENGCESVGQVNVLVQNVMFIPNLFTPNGDNSNDTFLVYGSGIATIDFQVYDLNGNRLYHTRNVEEAIRVGWDGTYQGAEMANGTYMWSISGRFHNGAPLKFNGQSKGTIKLLR